MGQTRMSAWSWMMVMKRDERTWQLRFNDGHEARRTPMAAWKKSDWTVTAGPSTIVLERTYGINHMDHGIFPSKRYINQIYAFVLFLHWASTRSMGERTPHYHTRSGPLPLLHLTMSLTIKVPSSRTSFPRRRPWQSRLPPPPPPSRHHRLCHRFVAAVMNSLLRIRPLWKSPHLKVAAVSAVAIDRRPPTNNHPPLATAAANNRPP